MTREVSARSHGALGDGRGDDGPALRRAAAAAIAAGADLVLEPGTYLCRPEQYCYAFELSGARALRVRADGATLLVGTPLGGGLALSDCEGVTVEGLEVDYDPEPWFLGEVTYSDPEHLRFGVRHAGGLALSHPGFEFASTAPHPHQFGGALDPEHGGSRADLVDAVFVEEVSGTGPEWDLRSSGGGLGFVEGLRRGDLFAYVARGPGHAVALQGGRDNRLSRITVRAASGCAFLVQASSAAVIEDCSVARREGRLISSCADGVHAQNCPVGPRVTGCRFEAMMDDGLNIYATPLVVMAADGCHLRLARGAADLQAGHVLELFSPAEGRLRGTARVREVLRRAETDQEVELDRAVPGLTPGLDHRSSDIACDLDAAGAGFLVSGNTFRRHRGLAMRIRACDGSVEGNRIEDVGSAGILVGNDADWPEGPVPRRIQLSRNQIWGAGLATGAPGLYVSAVRTGGRPTPEPIIEDVTITGNVIRGCRGGSLSLSGATRVVLEGNDFDTEPVVSACGEVSRGAAR